MTRSCKSSRKSIFFTLITIFLFFFIGVINSFFVKANTTDTNIMGISTVSEQSVINLFKATKPTEYEANPSYYNEVIHDYYLLAPIYGIKPEVALAQCFVETGWLQFGGDAQKEWNNFCGLGIGPTTNSLNGVDPTKVYIVDYTTSIGIAKQGIAFYKIEYGVEAHLQHLISYAKKGVVTKSTFTSIYSRELLDPRYDFNSSAATTVSALGGTWASDTTYGTKIMTILNQLPTIPEGITYTNAVADGQANTQNSSKITITLSKEPSTGSLTADDVTLSSTANITKGSLLALGSGVYDLEITGTWNEGDTVDVKIDKTGVSFTPDTKTVTTHKKVDMNGLMTDGTYTIVSSLNLNKVLDIPGNSQLNSAKVQLYDSNGTGAQQYKITNLGDNIYTIQVIGSGKYLDVAGANTANGTTVWQYEYNGSNAQKWKLIQNNDSTFSFQSLVDSNKYLDVAGANTANGTKLQIYSGNGTDAQKFMFLPVGNQILANGTYKIGSIIGTNMVLDIALNSKYTRANLQIYQSNGSTAQQFIVKHKGAGYYTIQVVGSGKMLDVAGAGTSNGTNVWQYGVNNSAAQDWLIIAVGNGKYSLVSRASGLYMDVSGGKGTDGTNIQTWQGNGTNAQIFTFEFLSENTTLSILSGKTIVIDPGHGVMYDSPGAIGIDGTKEEIRNYEYAMDLVDLLEIAGANVIVTHGYPDSRNNSLGNTLKEELTQRANIANTANADIFISIHCNSALGNSVINGSEIYYYCPLPVDDPFYSERDPRIVSSKSLAGYILPKVVVAGGFKNRGVKGGDYNVIRNTSMPAILIEVGFLSNWDDTIRIANNRSAIVEGIYEGILEYFANN